MSCAIQLHHVVQRLLLAKTSLHLLNATKHSPEQLGVLPLEMRSGTRATADARRPTLDDVSRVETEMQDRRLWCSHHGRWTHWKRPYQWDERLAVGRRSRSNRSEIHSENVEAVSVN